MRGGCQIKEVKPGRVLLAGNVCLRMEGVSFCWNETPASGTTKPWQAPQAKKGEQGRPLLQQPSSARQGMADRNRMYKGNR